MQRSQSAVDFSNLLSPEVKAESKQPRTDGDMTTAGMLRPNGPLPGTQNGETTEMPRPYKCTMCDKAFHRLEHQTRHIRTHTGEKPHACMAPGCTKRFSRSDELTRHTRIHSNPNSRRGNKAHPQHTLMHGLQPDMMPPPPAPKAIRSAPPTAISSPNVSPPHYSSYNFAAPSGLNPYSQTRGTLGSQSGPDMVGVLQRAAHKVDRDSMLHPHPPNYYPPSARLHHPSSLYGPRGQLPGLGAYHMSRTHSHDEQDDHYHPYRHAKRSRPNSPNSTAPSSPTFSHSSLSPTPDHTPLATPAHSPRLRPMNLNPIDMQLPPFRHLSLHHQPALAPLEPQPDNMPAQPVLPTRPGGALTEILSQPDSSQRKLPVPKVAIHDFLNPTEPFHGSMRSS